MTSDRSKKILLVNKFYSPTIGGVESVVKQHARFLDDSGNKITVLCCNDRFSLCTRVEWMHGVKVVRCASLGTFMSMPIAPTFLFWLWMIAWKNRLIIFHLPFPLATVSALTMPFRRSWIVFWHSDIVQQKRLKPIVQFFQHCLCRRSKRILTTSAQLFAFSDVLGAHHDKVGIIPLSVPDSAPSVPDVAPVGLPLLPRNYGLFLGRLCYYKGVDVLLDALTILADEGKMLPVVLVGDGPLKSEVEQMLVQRKLPEVTFIGRHVNEAEKVWLLANSSYLLFPSTEPSEAFGIIQLEAMVQGVPVINSNLPTGVPWVSEDGRTGLTVTPRDPVALAEAMSKLVENEQKRRQMGREAVQRVADLFSDSQVCARLHEEINRALDHQA